MDTKYVNLDRYGIPGDVEIQITVYLIAADLKTRKLMNTLASIGCDGCFCLSHFCDLILPLVGFANSSDELYQYYYDMLAKHCGKVTDKNDLPIEEALC